MVVLASGEEIADRFIVHREAGRGGMGIVYAATDRSSGKQVAVKVMLGGDAPALARFHREAATLATLNAPGIVRYIAHGETSRGLAFLAMEWLEGEDLAKRLGRGPLDLESALKVIEGAAHALVTIHSNGLIHRDIKPSNIFLLHSDPREVRLLDFGIARSVASGSTVTATGAVVGTPQYMAAEQVRGDRSIDARVDVCALGWVLFDCIAGQRAFHGENPLEILAAVLLRDPPRLRQVVPSVPASIDALVYRMTSRERSLRPADASAVLLELNSARKDIGADTPSLSEPASPEERRFMSLVVAHRRIPDALTVDLPNEREPNEYRSPRSECPEPVPLPARAIELGAAVELVGPNCVLAMIDRGATAREQAERAVRLAEALAAESEIEVVRVVSGYSVMRGRVPGGELLRRAMERAADDGVDRLLIDELTANLVAGSFELTVQGSMATVRGERRVLDAERLRRPGAARFVGREREMAILEAALTAAREESELRAVMIVAPPGLGKSRLITEFVASAQRRGDVRVLGVRAEVQAAGSPYRVLGDVLGELAEVCTTAQETRTALDALVTRCLPEAEHRRAAAVLASLVRGASRAEDAVFLDASRREPLLFADLVRRYVRCILSAESDRATLLVVIEDVHWGDLPSIDALTVSGAALRDHPLLLLATARPEVDERFSGFWAGLGPERIVLAPLGRKPAERLVREQLGISLGAAVDIEAAVHHIVERAEGSPLFLEELALGARTGGALPANVLAVVQARFDVLDEVARRTLQAASVFGGRCWPAGVLAVLGLREGNLEILAATQAAFGELEERGMLAARSRSSFAAEPEYELRGGLLRDAAYALWSEAERPAAHARAAAWLLKMGETDAVVLACHFTQANETRAAAAQWATVAHRALAGGDYATAMRAIASARALTTTPELEVELALVESDVHFHRKDVVHALASARAARDGAPLGSELGVRAATSLILAAGQCGRNDVVLSTALSLVNVLPSTVEQTAAVTNAIARALTQLGVAGGTHVGEEKLWLKLQGLEASMAGTMPPSVRMFVSRAHGLAAFRAGRFEEAVAQFQSSVDAPESIGDWRNAGMARTTLAGALTVLGQHERAEAVVQQSIADAEQGQSPYLAEWGRYVLGKVMIGRSRWADALSQFSRAIEALKDSPRLRTGAHAYAARALEELGRRAEAETHASIAIEETTGTGVRIAARAVLSRVLVFNRRFAEALDVASVAYRELADSGGVEDDFGTLIKAAYAEALYAGGRQEEACAVIATARALLEQQAAQMSSVAVREAFLTRPPESARIFRYAREWRSPAR